MKSSELETETPVNKNISIASTSKLSSPPCKIYKKDSPEPLSLTTCKQFSSPSTETSIGDSSRSLTGSVASHKFPSRKSFPPTKTKHLNGRSKLVLQKKSYL
ncbi:hypothetical protein TNIN_197041 [Trichonephila inaurata madagascariensis]|uniref:Uncharacterized protein n=1 Tax=Trichonephila inaurata madagascariensis TaxID=2747483 RepID=A0A8X7CE79_9ARAC|nr:hypothetical protein TNIN_197041 [Trichonephila inaurata madagascariensis]